MELFTIELVSNESAQLIHDNTLSSFTNFVPEQLNLEGQCEVAISEIYYPSIYQNVTEAKFMFFDKKHSKSSKLFYLELGLYPANTLKPKTFSFKKDTNTTKTVSKLKCLEERRKFRFTLRMNDLVLHSLVRIWDTFSEVLLVMNLE